MLFPNASLFYLTFAKFKIIKKQPIQIDVAYAPRTMGTRINHDVSESPFVLFIEKPAGCPEKTVPICMAIVECGGASDSIISVLHSCIGQAAN